MKSPSSPPLLTINSIPKSILAPSSIELAVTQFIENYVARQQNENADLNSKGKVRYLFSDNSALQKLQLVIRQFEVWEAELTARKVSTSKLSQVTDQEQKIIHLIANGLQTKEIAHSLFISEHTVQTHRKNINKKLGTNSVIDMVKVSMMLSLL